MADGRLTVLIALADRRRAEELAAHLTEAEGIFAVLAEEIETAGPADGGFDAVVSDDVRRTANPATVLIADDGQIRRDQGGVRATLRQNAGDALVAAAVRLAAAGYTIARQVAPAGKPAARGNGSHHAELLPPVSLTHREREVIALLAEGASNKVIARRLDISVHTAKFHVAAILEKLGAVNRTDAIAIAMREGLVLV
jgi:DNA-binding NarL/FixJ family response regulator